MTSNAPKVEMFFSYRSPYSYLAIKRIANWSGDENIDLQIRPVLPLAIRQPEFFRNANPVMPRYVRRDTARVAAFHQIPFRWPSPDPVVMTFDPVRIPQEQPYIHRLTRLGIEAARQNLSVPFTEEVSSLIWSGAVADWTVGTHLADAVARAGLDLAAMDRAIEENVASYDDQIARNQEDHQAAGHWGVPTIVFNGEPFFGQDRIDLLAWRLKEANPNPQTGSI